MHTHIFDIQHFDPSSISPQFTSSASLFSHPNFVIPSAHFSWGWLVFVVTAQIENDYRLCRPILFHWDSLATDRQTKEQNAARVCSRANVSNRHTSRELCGGIVWNVRSWYNTHAHALNACNNKKGSIWWSVMCVHVNSLEMATKMNDVCVCISLDNNAPWSSHTIEGCSDSERDEITCSFTMMHMITLIVYLNDGSNGREKRERWATSAALCLGTNKT